MRVHTGESVYGLIPRTIDKSARRNLRAGAIKAYHVTASPIH